VAQIILDRVLANVLRLEALDGQIGTMTLKNLSILLPDVRVGAEGRLERDEVAKEHALLGAELRAKQEVGCFSNGGSDSELWLAFTNSWRISEWRLQINGKCDTDRYQPCCRGSCAQHESTRQWRNNAVSRRGLRVGRCEFAALTHKSLEK
jgi:hypothetical protein